MSRALFIFVLALGGCSLDLGPSEGRGNLTGRVEIAATGELMSGVQIRVMGVNDENIDVFTTVGVYRVEDLTPGQYVVTLMPPFGYEVAPNTHGTAPIEIVANQTRTVNFQLRAISQ